MKKPAIAYLRRSTRGQESTFTSQQDHIEEFCRRNNYTLVKVVRESKSGRHNSQRPEFEAVMETMKQSPDLTLIVSTLDRFARGLATDCRWLLNKLRFAGHPDTPMSQMEFNIRMAFAEEESDAISRRVKAAYKTLKKQKGEDLKWGAPLGSGPVLDETREKGLAKRQGNAAADAVRLWGHIETLEGRSLFCGGGIDISSLNWSCLSRRLNSLGVKSRRGGEIKPSNLKRVIVTAIERGVVAL
jgi:DNA invertase Pin-like site-specific DNA recombinase